MNDLPLKALDYCLYSKKYFLEDYHLTCLIINGLADFVNKYSGRPNLENDNSGFI
jgi:hypothetical protein